MPFGSVSRKHVLHRDVSDSDLEKVVKSRSRILNEGLGVSAGLGFYHSIPLMKKFVTLFLRSPYQYLMMVTFISAT